MKYIIALIIVVSCIFLTACGCGCQETVKEYNTQTEVQE
jgi:hypothetical protein